MYKRYEKPAIFLDVAAVQSSVRWV